MSLVAASNSSRSSRPVSIWTAESYPHITSRSFMLFLGSSVGPMIDMPLPMSPAIRKSSQLVAMAGVTRSMPV